MICSVSGCIGNELLFCEDCELLLCKTHANQHIDANQHIIQWLPLQVPSSIADLIQNVLDAIIAATAREIQRCLLETKERVQQLRNEMNAIHSDTAARVRSLNTQLVNIAFTLSMLPRYGVAKSSVHQKYIAATSFLAELPYCLFPESIQEVILRTVSECKEIQVQRPKQGNTQTRKEAAEQYFSNAAQLEESRDYHAAIESLQSCLPLCKDNDLLDLACKVYMKLGTLLQQTNNTKEAADHFNSCAELSRTLSKQSTCARALLNLGNMYLNQNQYKEAIEPLQEAIGLYEVLNQYRFSVDTLHSLGRAWKGTGNTDYAFECYSRAIQLCLDNQLRGKLGELYVSVGNLHRMCKSMMLALEAYKMSIDIFRQQRRQADLAQALHNIGGVQLRLGMRHEAAEALSESLEIRRTLGLRRKMQETIQLLRPLETGLDLARYRNKVEK